MNIPILIPVPQTLTLTGGSRPATEPETQLDTQIAHEQGYHLAISADGIRISARTEAGLFYGRQTLAQLVRQYGETLPCLVIEDWPALPVRGVMLDISRDRVPTMDTLRLWIDRLAALKINQLQLYIEHTFAYAAHPDIWREASPLTGAEIEELDALCRARFIDLVPCQNSFGHMERWLIHPQYADLGITDERRLSAMGDPRLPSTLNPLDERSIALVASLCDELLPHFSSDLLNLGADEPFELGKGKTVEAVNARGKGVVYLEYLLKLHALATQHSKTMQFWGDIIIHYPELIPQLPRDIIALDWGYEAQHDFDAHAAVYARAGIPFYLCPGTSTWMSYTGSTTNMLANVSRAVKAALKHGASGVLITDWGDNGHWQSAGISLAGFAAAAAMTWNATSADMTAESLAPLLDMHIYEGNLAAPALALGEIYQRFGAADINGNFLAYALQRRFSEIPNLLERFQIWGNGPQTDLSPANLRGALADIAALTAQIAQADINAPDGELLREEYLHAAALLAHAAKRLLLMQGASDLHADAMQRDWQAIEAAQIRLWHKRSREGGLKGSLARFAIAYEDYRT